MLDMTIDVHGLDDLDAALAQLAINTQHKVVEQSLMSAALPMMRAAKQHAARSEQAHNLLNQKTGQYTLIQPGTLQNSIKRTRLKKRENPTIAIRVGKKNNSAPYPYYWYFVEHGTSKMQAIPYLRPAFEATWQQVVEKFKTEMQKRIEKATRQTA